MSQAGTLTSRCFICRSCGKEVILPASHPGLFALVVARRCPICIGKIRAGVEVVDLSSILSDDGVRGGQGRTAASSRFSAFVVAVAFVCVVVGLIVGSLLS